MSGSGYGQPPKDTRFKKGQSGNPKGRPKSVGAMPSNASKLVLDAASRMISVREGEEVREISVIEAMIRAQQSAALKGSALAQTHAIELVERATVARKASIDDDNERWRQIEAKLRIIYADADKHGRGGPLPLPHPDDIIIDPERGVSIIGPIDEEEQAKLNDTLRVRDLLIVQDVLDERLDTNDGVDPLDRAGSALALMRLLNDRVPARFRLSEVEIIMKMTRAKAMTKRRLLTVLYQDWRAALSSKTSSPVAFTSELNM